MRAKKQTQAVNAGKCVTECEIDAELNKAKEGTLKLIGDFFAIGGIDWPIGALTDALCSLTLSTTEPGSVLAYDLRRDMTAIELNDRVLCYRAMMTLFTRLFHHHHNIVFLKQAAWERGMNELL